MATATKPRPQGVSTAQARYLRHLLANPSYVGTRGRTGQTRDALIRKGLAVSTRRRGGLRPLWDPDRGEWLG